MGIVLDFLNDADDFRNVRYRGYVGDFRGAAGASGFCFAEFLAVIPVLKKVDLWHANLTDQELANLAKIKSLEYLDITSFKSNGNDIEPNITGEKRQPLRRLKGTKRVRHGLNSWL